MQQYIDHYQEEIGHDYIVVHTRFLNLLGDKVENDINPELPYQQRTILMEGICAKIKEISKRCCNSRLMLASDSMTFIHYMKKEIPEAYIVPGQIKHIDTSGDASDAEIIKMFLDYYLICNAKKVYSIISDGMWPSAFPEYAAKIGCAKFERVLL